MLIVVVVVFFTRREASQSIKPKQEDKVEIIAENGASALMT